MTARYEWTPASEPPDTERTVIAWIINSNTDAGGDWMRLKHLPGLFEYYSVTHWRDVAPPNSSATLTGSPREGE